MARDPNNFVGDYFFQPCRKESVDFGQLCKRTTWILAGIEKHRPKHKCPPYIFVLRDGLSEGQFDMVWRLNIFLSLLLHCCQSSLTSTYLIKNFPHSIPHFFIHFKILPLPNLQFFAQNKKFRFHFLYKKKVELYQGVQCGWNFSNSTISHFHSIPRMMF